MFKNQEDKVLLFIQIQVLLLLIKEIRKIYRKIRMLLFRWMSMLMEPIIKGLIIPKKYKDFRWMLILWIYLMKNLSYWFKSWEKEMLNIMLLWLRWKINKRECKIKWERIQKTLINSLRLFKSICWMEIKNRSKLRRKKKMKLKRKKVQREWTRLNSLVKQDRVQQ